MDFLFHEFPLHWYVPEQKKNLLPHLKYPIFGGVFKQEVGVFWLRKME